MRITTIFTLLLLFISACTPVSAANPTPMSTVNMQKSPTPTTIDLREDCVLEPVEAPSLPDSIPAYGEIDPATGLHMTGEAMEVSLDSYRLKVSGLVDNPLSLTYDKLRCLPKVSDDPLLDCPGFFQDKATWAGAFLSAILNLAQPQASASKINMVSADGYRTEMDLEQAANNWNFLAYELEGKPLPALHGFPVRAVFPGLHGSYWAKWLVEIEIR